MSDRGRRLLAALAFFALIALVPLGPDRPLRVGAVPHDRPLLAAHGLVHVRSVAFVGQQVWAASVYALVLVLALAWLGRPRERLALGKRVLEEAARTGLALGAGLVVVGGAGLALAARVSGGAFLRRFLDGLDAPLLLDGLGSFLLTLTSVALAPLAEELVFRGIVLDALSGELDRTRAAIVQAFLFAALHVRTGLPPATLALPFVWGLVAARVVRRSSGSLGGAVVLHALGNAVGLVLIAFAMDHGAEIVRGLTPRR